MTEDKAVTFLSLDDAVSCLFYMVVFPTKRLKIFFKDRIDRRLNTESIMLQQCTSQSRPELQIAFHKTYLDAATVD